ncbi:MAG: PBP1A family penicillin-binding protein [Oligoflexia bacterium]|nr:PBP1A family penicillin-binding protein [Oligoflexia bacterium]
MVKKRWAIILIITSISLLALGAFGLVIWGTRLNTTIKDRLAGKRWAAPTEFYAAPERFLKGQSQISKTLSSTLERLEYQNILVEKKLTPGDFTKWTPEICKQKVQAGIPDDTVTCWAIKPRQRSGGAPPTNTQIATERALQVLAVNAEDVIVEVYEGEPPQTAAVIELEPELFAQFYGGQPVLRQIVSLGDVPPHLLNAVLAIEDSAFLTHRGVSWSGMLRAAFRNIMKRHVAEGGSTITQQLIKNYFLTPERTFKRKITEILMALLLESQFTKDDILETYINEVYLGQTGPFEIHGVGVAAKNFFNKRVGELSIGESALLAGSIRGPNTYNPFKHAVKSQARRNVVLKRMRELELISAEEYELALNETLPIEKKQLLRDLAPFFIDSVKFQLQKLKLSDLEGLQVYTTLNLRAQQAATASVTEGLAQIEKQYASIQKTEKSKNIKLQAVLISADPTNGFVEAVVGGRAYNETQLNRAVNSQRQVGSIFKPFVFLAAFSSNDQNGSPYTPLTQILDEPFTIKYDKQSWTPQNYKNEYEGNIPLYRALEGSLNASTSKIALQVGIPKVIDVARRAGIDTSLQAVPSIALGSAGLTPLEVLQSYCTLARRGELNPLTFIYVVMNATGDILYEFKPARSQSLDPIEVRQTVSLMEGVFLRGTGRGIPAQGFTHPAAGKTGTTSDTKDVWFGGFTPLHAAVVWVGFDQPTPTGLTGATGAIPLWTQYMKTYASRYPPVDFAIPEGASIVAFDPASGMLAKPTCAVQVRHVFKNGTAPSSECWLH